MKVIIEHLDEKVYPWSLLEYKHISEIVGKDKVVFSNVKADKEKLVGLGEVTDASVTQLGLNPERTCILDPKGTETISPSDADKFDTFVFGGVLGNHPMDGRTSVELTKKMHGCGARNIGNVQMSTDTAVLAVKKIIVDKIPFSDLEFKDNIEIETEPGFSTQLPYRYLVENGEIVLPEGFVEFLNSEENTF